MQYHATLPETNKQIVPLKNHTSLPHHHHHQRRFNSHFPGEPSSPLVSPSTLLEEKLWGISGTRFL